MERFLYANLILVHISERQGRRMHKCVQIHPGKIKARGWGLFFFFSLQKLGSPKKREKIPVKMSQMNAINVLMFRFCHFDPIKQEANKDESSDPWIALRSAVSAATAECSTGKEELCPKSAWIRQPQIHVTVFCKEKEQCPHFYPIADTSAFGRRWQNCVFLLSLGYKG